MECTNSTLRAQYLNTKLFFPQLSSKVHRSATCHSILALFATSAGLSFPNNILHAASVNALRPSIDKYSWFRVPSAISWANWVSTVFTTGRTQGLPLASRKAGKADKIPPYFIIYKHDCSYDRSHLLNQYAIQVKVDIYCSAVWILLNTLICTRICTVDRWPNSKSFRGVFTLF